MKDNLKRFYGQSAFWDRDYSKNPAEKERIDEVIKIIPPDTRSVLDVGCGNGFFVNTLVNTFSNRFDSVIALDPSEEALKYVEAEKLDGSIANLPFEDESFDLLTSLEVLEHLPQEDFKRGIFELQRVSKKYILITVPNGEDLASSWVICPKCYCRFNPNFHVRSFDKDILASLFENFKPIEVKEIGPVVKTPLCNRPLLTLYRSWKKSILPETAMCPQCGYQHKGRFKNLNNNKNCSHFSSRVSYLFKALVKLILPTRKRTRWLLALYEKADS